MEGLFGGTDVHSAYCLTGGHLCFIRSLGRVDYHKEERIKIPWKEDRVLIAPKELM